MNIQKHNQDNNQHEDCPICREEEEQLQQQQQQQALYDFERSVKWNGSEYVLQKTN